MRFGNCYTFALGQYRKHGGWLVLRRSVKSWVPHMQWGASGLELGAERLPSWRAGFRKIMGPDRGYLIWNRSGCYWRARISALQIIEYLPPEWVNRLTSRYRIAQILPVHAIAFFGWVRQGSGEQHRTQTIIDETWPHDH